ncbi:tail fiber protein [Flavivirga sp. MEBiC05379]|uniref:Tail fiber protein n=2 Tax=Flavivirga spongiicola TaxID=421621 RepID=A0ABU7XUH9_9FLAO|nr:tail fiber protein [Flavivirga sp. MEBiC05379]MDO5979409.1 tail fiber protein [Flavivirga sp. MEBiC05379]
MNVTLHAQDEPLLGEIKMFAGNFAPRGWAFCDGQLLSIGQNTALFSLLGTTYGGDGRTTFALPDLRGRTPVHAGEGPSLTPIRLGQKGGQESQHLSEIYVLENESKSSKKVRVLGNNGAYKTHNTRSPYLGVKYIIALQGTYPSRY